MDLASGAVRTTVLVVAAVVLVSGPLVGAVDLTPASGPAPGEGAVELSVVSVPTDVRIEPGRYGSGEHYLRVPDAVVRIDAVRGRPLVVYRLRIPELGYARTSTHFLGEGDAGDRLRLSLPPAPIDRETLTRDAYRGELSIVVRASGTEELSHRSNVTVEVRT